MQAPFDLKAARCADVFQVDAAEGRGEVFDRTDDLLAVLGVQTDREGIDVGEFLEQDRLSFHDRKGGLCADIA